MSKTFKPPQATPPPVVNPPQEESAADAASTSDSNLILEVLPYVKLRGGGQSRRLELLGRTARETPTHDALIVQRLLGWLAANRPAWTSQPTSFTLNLSVASLEDDRFVQRVTTTLNTHGIGAETLGFEIAEPLCMQRRNEVERFVTACEKIGSWVVLDQFTLDSQVLPILRSKALRLVKIDPKLTSAALKDKLSQALVVATVQAAKVMGVHCSAKKVDSQAALQWLTAIGCDYAQGLAISGPLSLESIARL